MIAYSVTRHGLLLTGIVREEGESRVYSGQGYIWPVPRGVALPMVISGHEGPEIGPSRETRSRQCLAHLRRGILQGMFWEDAGVHFIRVLTEGCDRAFHTRDGFFGTFLGRFCEVRSLCIVHFSLSSMPSPSALRVRCSADENTVLHLSRRIAH